MEGTGLGTPGRIEYTAAAVAFQEFFAPLDRDQGNEKEADVMIQPFETSGRQPAGRAWSGLIIDLDLFRL